VIVSADEDVPRATDHGDLEYSVDFAMPMDTDCPQDCSSAEDVHSLTEGQTSSARRSPSSTSSQRMALSANIKKAQESKQSTNDKGPKFSRFTWDPLAKKTNANAEAAFERASQSVPLYITKTRAAL
jgi:hypothetical protein